MTNPLFPGIGENKDNPQTVAPAQQSNEIAALNRRLRIIEERLDDLRSHIELIDSNLVEKHKASITAIKELEVTIKDIREQVSDTKELFSRISNRLDSFATKENVKVLERYINIWNPMDSVNKNEVEELVKKGLENIRKSKSN